jgi:5-methylcytosine-specific restriction endonuclease McrA
VSSFHQDARWRGLRLQAKRRDGWRCVRCGSRVGLEVDHVEPRARRPELALVLDNLQTLCRSCHIDKTRAEQGLDSARQAWLDAVNVLAKTKARA